MRETATICRLAGFRSPARVLALATVLVVLAVACGGGDAATESGASGASGEE